MLKTLNTRIIWVAYQAYEKEITRDILTDRNRLSCAFANILLCLHSIILVLPLFVFFAKSLVDGWAWERWTIAQLAWDGLQQLTAFPLSLSPPLWFWVLCITVIARVKNDLDKKRGIQYGSPLLFHRSPDNNTKAQTSPHVLNNSANCLQPRV